MNILNDSKDSKLAINKKSNNNENAKTEVSCVNRQCALLLSYTCLHKRIIILGEIGSKMGEICMRQNQRPAVHDPVGSHDFAQNNIAAAIAEFF